MRNGRILECDASPPVGSRDIGGPPVSLYLHGFGGQSDFGDCLFSEGLVF